MSAGVLISVIIIYILSLVGSFVLMIFARKISDSWKRKFILLHTFFIVLYLLVILFFKNQFTSGILILFCSGIFISGMIVRSNLHYLLKIYFSLYLVSVIVFIYSPSLLFSLIVNQKFPEKKKTEFFIAKDYFLIREKALLDVPLPFVNYKIVKRMGVFNKTVQRNISFKNEIDSIRSMHFDENNSVDLRGYFRKNEGGEDSIDISIELTLKDANEIIIKRK